MARTSPHIYVPLDVNYADNARIITAGEAAELLYIRGLCLVKRQLSDGYIDAVQLPRLGLSNVEERAQRLVDVGLWERMPAVETRAETMGYVVVGWLERNPSAEELAAVRQKKIEAGTIGGIQSGKVRRKQPVDKRGRFTSVGHRDGDRDGDREEPSGEGVNDQSRRKTKQVLQPGG